MRNPRPCAVCGVPLGDPSSPLHVYVPAKRTEPLRAKRNRHSEHDRWENPPAITREEAEAIAKEVIASMWAKGKIW